MTEPSLDAEIIAKGLAIRGKSPAEVAAASGIPVEWIETNWLALTYRAPTLKKPKWVSAGERKRRHGWATRR